MNLLNHPVSPLEGELNALFSVKVLNGSNVRRRQGVNFHTMFMQRF